MGRHKNVTTLTERGQISVPAFIRKSMNFQPGTSILWEAASPNSILLTVLSERKPLGAKAMLGFGRHLGGKHKTTQAWLKELREGEK
jgi:bifunctional DNA-binding transcriptional regulator/antitoxin component of YhaV-PrlF toxin-antitoxin module